MPSLLEVAYGSAQHDPQTGAPPLWIAVVKADKAPARALIVRLRRRTQASAAPAAIEQSTI